MARDTYKYHFKVGNKIVQRQAVNREWRHFLSLTDMGETQVGSD